MNPAGLITWVVIVASVLSGAAGREAVVTVVGIGLGSAGWFVILACIARRGAGRFGHWLARLCRYAGLLLMTGGVVSLVRALHYWVA